VVSINGLDVYFSRFTGTVDGVGFSATSVGTPASTAQSGCSAALIAQLDAALARSPTHPEPRV
jgi:hypothetical protein